jgi:hypothetical protein
MQPFPPSTLPVATPRARPRDDYDEEPARREPRERRRSREDDYDDRREDYEEDYDAPRRRGRRRPARSGGKGLMIGLIIGGSLLLLIAVGVLLFLLLRSGGTASTEKLLIGTWEERDTPFRMKVEFATDGTVTVNHFFLLKGKYRVIDSNTVEVEGLGQNIVNDMFKDMGGAPPFKDMGGFPGIKDKGGFPGFGDMKMPGITVRWSISVSQNELTIRDPTKGNLAQRYTRIK